MTKDAMNRQAPDRSDHPAEGNPLLDGSDPYGKVKANPFITGADGKIYHMAVQAENKIPSVYPAIDNDLAVENIANDFDMTQADAQDLK